MRFDIAVGVQNSERFEFLTNHIRPIGSTDDMLFVVCAYNTTYGEICN